MEKSLISAIGQDEKRAFGLLYGIYSPKLISYASHNIPNPEDAEDIVQEVFLSLWNNRHSLRNRESISTFLFTSLRNRIANFHRDSIYTSIYTAYVKYCSNTHDDSIPLEYIELCRNLAQAMGRLNATQRKVIRLSRLYGISNQDISKTLNISIQTVKNSLSIGLRLLRKELSLMECDI